MIEKNTIWAIVLSTVVIIGAYFVLPLIMNKNAPKQEETVAEQVVENTTTSEVTEAITSETEEKIENAEVSEEVVAEGENVEVEEVVEAFEPAYEDKKITYVKNNNEVIVFSTKGGDIVSYTYRKNDKTDKFYELVKNSDDNNRACSISLGNAESKIINDVFKYEQDPSDSNVHIFTKKIKYNGKIVNLRKVYTFAPDEHMFKLDVMLHTDDGLNINGAAYTISTTPQIGPDYDPNDKYDSRQFISYDGKKSKKIQLSGNDNLKLYDKQSVWAGIASVYFQDLIYLEKPENINSVFYSSRIEGSKNEKDFVKAQAYFERKAFSEKDVTDTYYIYFGPRSENEIKKYNNTSDNVWKLGELKLAESLNTSQWLGWLENILHWCLNMIQKIIPNWGICIIVLTILLKALMFPLSKKQSMGTLKMQELQPKIKAVQEKYKDDKQKQNVEMQKIYQEAHYNPASGCLPLIFQFLILFAMYNMLRYNFDFFDELFIPGWIDNLAKGDMVGKPLSFDIPLLGNIIRILPVIYVASQILYSVITQNGGASAGQTGFNMKLMTYGMPILFFFLFYTAPSGLLLYWITSNLFQMIQQLVINAMMKKKKAEMAGNVPAKKTGKSTKK